MGFKRLDIYEPMCLDNISICIYTEFVEKNFTIYDDKMLRLDIKNSENNKLLKVILFIMINNC